MLPDKVREIFGNLLEGYNINLEGGSFDTLQQLVGTASFDSQVNIAIQPIPAPVLIGGSPIRE